MRAIKMIVAALALQGAIEASAQTQLLHPTNAVWRYQVDLATQQAAGTDWVNASFDDSAWPEGKGLFGNEANYPYAMITTGTGLGANLPMANYFRTHFTWSGSTAGVVLTGTNYIDDGSVIYLNGVEIARFNMPATANAGTPEASAVAANPGGFPNVNGGEPVLVRLQIDLDALTNGNVNPLISGQNLIAVQAHQSGTASSDRVFGLALYGSQAVAPCFSTVAPVQPTNRVILVGRSTTFTAIEQCGIPAPALQWYRDTGAGEELITGATAATYTVTNAAATDSGVYYAKATNSKGTATSRQASLTVNVDGQPPKLLSGRLSPGSNFEVIVTADEPLCPDDNCSGNASLAFNWEIFVEGDENQQLGIAGIVVTGNIVTFTLDGSTPWVTDTRYVVRLQLFGAGSIGDLYGNLLNGGDPFSSVTTPVAASAISVRSPGDISDLYTFDSAPSSLEFTTSAMAGGAGDQTTAAGLEPAIQALDASTITTGLASATGTPPGNAGLGQYASDGKYLITRPTGTLANNIVAHLRNDTGSAKGSLKIDYTLGVETTVAEEVPGQLVYYSLSGAPNTWVAIPALSGGTAGAKTSGDISLGADAWVAGASLYVVWVDDNGSGSPDIAYEIDNLQFTAGGTIADTNRPTLVRVSASNNTTILLTFSEKMAASAGTTAPYTITGASVTAASLSADGREVTLTTSARPVGIATLTIAGVQDASLQANLITPNPTTVKITTQQKIADWNTAWDYATNAQTGASWTTTGGTGWQTGNALFGTETSAGVVAIMPTPIATVIPPPNAANEFMVSYFRKQITLPALSAGQAYAIGHITDDGLVAYIDGVEIGRFNMPAGPVTATTVAVAGIEGSLQALPFLATAGNHTLAIEVHQNANTSSDMLFGASVLVIPTAPALSISHVGTNAVVSWSADASWVLTGSTNVAGPYNAVGGAASPSFSRPIATPETQFYKLNYVPQP